MADYTQMANSIRRIVAKYLKSLALTDYCVGTVVAVQPLKIKVTDRIIADAEAGQIILTEAVLEKQLDLTHLHLIQGNSDTSNTHTHPINLESQNSLITKITITEGLKMGDKVHLLRVQNGQRYVVLSKIREKNKVVIDVKNIWKWS